MRSSNKVVAPHIFAIRHLSPSGAWHLLHFLDKVQPTAVLVEGPADANDIIPDIVRPESAPPLALLAYTLTPPIQTLLYPYAVYSPEYQALRWAVEHDAVAAFIDLPSDVMLALHYANTEAGTGIESEPGNDLNAKKPEQATANRRSIYDLWAEKAGVSDHESYWEYRFEHNMHTDSYRLAAAAYGDGIRQLLADQPRETALHLVREAQMRAEINRYLEEGHQPERIVIVAGAYHHSALNITDSSLPLLSSKELRKLPNTSTRLTLMPYTYYRLSERSGYGAGNEAPAYFELLWQGLNQENLDVVAQRYLSSIAFYQRQHGSPRSTAEVIEATRLARSLAALHGGSQPVLSDLRDAAKTCLGHGDFTAIAEATASAEIGTVIGTLPDGVVKTAIQEDFTREIKRLKLEKYQSSIAQSLSLDLRENRRVKSQEAAFIDLMRSRFLHQLRLLGIGFARQRPTGRSESVWAEHWNLQWTPEIEIQLVEASLSGETIVQTVEDLLLRRLELCESLEDAAEIILSACTCGLETMLHRAEITLQSLAVDAASLDDIAGAASKLALVVSFGDLRRFNTAPLEPLLARIFQRGVLLLPEATDCDLSAAKQLATAMLRLEEVAKQHRELVAVRSWLDQLAFVADSSSRNPLLSGLASSLLLERGLLGENELNRQISFRLSSGMEPSRGADWFEGLMMRGRTILLARLSLWRQLDIYLENLDEEAFRSALVTLRRTLALLDADEKRRVCENLGQIWNWQQDLAELSLNKQLSLSEAELLQLARLEEFDFKEVVPWI